MALVSMQYILNPQGNNYGFSETKSTDQDWARNTVQLPARNFFYHKYLIVISSYEMFITIFNDFFQVWNLLPPNIDQRLVSCPVSVLHWLKSSMLALHTLSRTGNQLLYMICSSMHHTFYIICKYQYICIQVYNLRPLSVTLGSLFLVTWLVGFSELILNPQKGDMHACTWTS